MGIFEIMNAVNVGFHLLNNFFSIFSTSDDELEKKVYGFSSMSEDIKKMVQTGNIDEKKLYEIAKNLDEMADFLKKVYFMLK